MSTITITLPDELKERVAAAAERAGTNPHSFIVTAIAEKVEPAEVQGELHATADQRYAKIVASDKAIAWADNAASP